MKLLYDQNLSRRLVAERASLFPGSAHVRELGLGTATDQEIRAYAADHAYIVVSKDSDFRQLAFLLGPPPKAIWLRVGNCSTTEIADLLRASHDAIARFEASTPEALLVLPGFD